MDNLTQILEAILFASGTSKKKSDILELLPNATKAQFDKSVEILKEKYSAYNSIPADIIDRDVSNYSSQLVLNIGKKHGVDVGMTVIAEEGLVGHIVSVTNSSSTVQVIIDASSSVSAMITTSSPA